MKNLYIAVFIALAASSTFISSCSYNPGPNSVPVDTSHYSKLTFKKDFHARYDIFVVDTADKNGNNVDHRIDSTRINVQEIVVDTGITYKGKTNVARVVTYMPAPNKNDTGYFYQDPNGDLYRYNYGFSILNQYTFLTQAIGHDIDVGWVLAAKIEAPSGTTWVAKIDTEHIQAPQLDVFLTSQATMKDDTTILVGTETIKARHVQHKVTASTPPGIAETGEVNIDSYMSADLSAVLIDFFRHSTLQGQLSNSKTQGKIKIMTSHN